MTGTANSVKSHLSPKEKRSVVLASLRRKIELLGSWLEDGLPPGQTWKKTVKEVSEWEDTELEVTRWKSPNITAPSGPNPNEARALVALLKQINTPAATSLEQENRELKATVKALSGQIARLARQLRVSERDLRIASAQASEVASATQKMDDR
ncbi:hypothetical protein EJC49_04440 [Aquibium carbonis]|uniref:Uncharacterized protein n=1 Tax=Aquibium carbonis TaxID=2495581 RepID=A0A3R9YA19_9HYPH|nr:hypothetical protein [Aquibium carbonis]RST87603.1 hypothetical protein EJC49_04440 [Aquibium carbonis]